MRVSEVYVSVQGEGPNVGDTTVFLRFGGCNLRCPGWPCDTQHAIDPAYRKEWKTYSPADLLRLVRDTASLAGARRVTLTGGEPFLQNHGELAQLVGDLRSDGFRIEAFSNGTLAYPDWVVNNIQFIMDWKLPGSGEDKVGFEVREQNIELLSTSNLLQSVKFVCNDEDDFFRARSLWSLYLKETPLRTYYGKVWDGDITDARLAELIMYNKLPWYLNVQMHNLIWPANERGR